MSEQRQAKRPDRVEVQWREGQRGAACYSFNLRKQIDEQREFQMSQSIQRGVRRLQAIQESRSVAWIILIAMLPIAFFSLIALISRFQSGVLVSVGGAVSGVAFVSAVWVAGHLFRETRRLGRLLRDPERVMRLERDPDLVEGIQWSGFLPFSGWRS